jgi:hypothetical protein
MPEAQDVRRINLIDDEGGDTRWMTYAELGRARGINTASAKRLASRRRWRRQPDNDGTARVAVPVDEARYRTGNAYEAGDDVTRLVSGPEAALATLREQLERERKIHRRTPERPNAARCQNAQGMAGGPGRQQSPPLVVCHHQPRRLRKYS